ncbi:MAG TPA: hypothetical protein VN081_00540 [Dongiaceae bacterium]|nr:hypothetical protein [Dongiaceae bacterium]
MSELFTRQEEIAFYSPRSGEGVIRAVEKLGTVPERPLDEVERADVLHFEGDLFRGLFEDGENRYEANAGGDLEYLTKKLSYGTTVKQVYKEFLGTSDARAAYSELGIPDDAFETGYTLPNFYAAVRGLDKTTLRKLEERSRTWGKGQVVTALVEGVEVPELSPVKVFSSPDGITQKLWGLAKYRRFLGEVGHMLDTADDRSNAHKAKQTIVTIYQKVLNKELAENYPNALALWDQLRSTNDQEAMKALAAAWPSGEHLARLPLYARPKYIVGLDRIRNGTSLEHKKFSAVTTSLANLAEKIDAQEDEPSTEASLAVFTPEEVEKLSSIKLDAEAMQAFCKAILMWFGKLSSEPEEMYERGRKKRATDGKWQVVLDDFSDSLEVNGIEGVLKIPQKFNRSLTRAQPPIGAISGAAHEISHIFQNDALAANTGSLVLSKDLRGRSSMALREAGGILIEQQVQEALFGQRRSYETYYMRALEDIEAGKPLSEVLKYSYELRRRHSDDTPEQIATNTFDRISRLQRYGGFDSQPLNYLQSALIIEASQRLNDEQKNRLFAEGAFDLPDMVALHEYGLNTSTPEPFPLDQFITWATQYLRVQLEMA